MFHTIPDKIKKRMKYLENLNSYHRTQQMVHWQRLRQIPPETGQFLALLATAAPAGTYLEIGTSGGYSALWISLACRLLNRQLITIEILEEKAQIAKETFSEAGISDIVKVIVGDARDFINDYHDISFCFLDAEKDVYIDCYKKLIPNMVSGGILIADNVISHKTILEDMINFAIHDNRVDALVVPVGSGVLLSRKV